MKTSKAEFFNPAKLSARDKADAIDQSARAIIAAESTAREKKTEKLRALRLQQAAAEEPAAAAPKQRRSATRKTAAKR